MELKKEKCLPAAVSDRFEAKAIDRLCLGLVRLFCKFPLKYLSLRHRAVGSRFESREKYVADRVSNTEEYRRLFSSYCSFTGKTVAELGCSTGYLLSSFLEHEAFSAIGIDIDGGVLTRGRAAYGSRIRFVQSTRTSIPLPDQSVDFIYCIDTVEHLKCAREILMDCYRILRPQGTFLIHFHPWFGPYGAHLEDIIPFPWPHVIFPMDSLLRVAAHIYDSADYEPACYWYDADTGHRRPNPYVDRDRWEEFLNRMTIGRFKRLLKSLPYEIKGFRRLGFGGKAYHLGRLTKGLAHAPILDEFFVRAVFCILTKPDAHSDQNQVLASRL